MPTASVKPYLPEGRVHRSLPFDLWVPALVLVALIAVAVLGSALRTGPYVAKVSFANNANYSFEVSVAGSSSAAVTLLGNAAAKSTTSALSVYDQGSNWTFRFSTQDRYVGEVVMTRSELQQSGWQVVIPDRFAQALAAQGVVPTN
jgi:hypothetical protein